MRKYVIPGILAAGMLATSAAAITKADGFPQEGPPGTATDADLTACTTERYRAQTLVAKGDPNGFLFMGRLYFFGLCVPHDREKARQNLERAEALGRTCAPVLLQTDRMTSAGERELKRQALFRRCAYRLARSEDLRLAKRVVAEMLSPAKVPVELSDEIERLIEIFRNSPKKTFALALRFISPENPAVLRKAAQSWLSRLAVKQSPVETEAQYRLGMLVFEPDGSPVKEKRGGWLKVIAPRGHIPAQRDLGRYYLGRSNDVQDHVRGYAWLLVAKRNGLDVGDLLQEAGKRLGAEKIADAEGLSETLLIRRRP